MATTRQIAKAANIYPRTRRYTLRDEFGIAYEGSATDHVLAALCRADITPDIEFRARIVALGLRKCYTTGRMNVHLARIIRENLTPYQLCGMVAKILTLHEGEPSIGELADYWINANADALVNR